MLYNKYIDSFDELALSAACENLQEGLEPKIPFLVWLLENPSSPLSLPGKISLLEHDYIHLLLKKSFAPIDEAYIVGFTMGNDTDTGWIHLWILKFVSYLLYPREYRWNYQQLKVFDRGVDHGKKAKVKNLNKLDWAKFRFKHLKDIRLELELDLIARFNIL